MEDLSKSVETDTDINLSSQSSVSFKDLCKSYKSLIHKWQYDRHHNQNQNHRASHKDDHEKFNISGPKLLSRTISAKVGGSIPHINIPQSTTCISHFNSHSPNFHKQEFVISSPRLLVRTTSSISPMPTPTLSKDTTKSKDFPSFDDDEELHISSPTLVVRTTSRISSGPNPSFCTNSTSNSEVNNSSKATDAHGGFPEVSTPKVVSPMTTTPIFFSQSKVRRKPPPVEKKLECSLEELCFGCMKKINIKREALSSNGLIIQEEDVLMIKVKPGWRKGTKIIFEGKGDEKPGTLPADLVFEIEEKRHPLYERKGDDLELVMEISLLQALTECTMSVPLLGGEQLQFTMDDDGVIYPGYETTIAGQGMPRSKQGKRGDLRLKIIVSFPSHLSNEQRYQIANVLEYYF